MTMKIETRNLDDLSIHPAIKSQPRLSDDELLEWRKGLKKRGEQRVPPISITSENEIVDGRHRYWCARKLGWKTIPVEVVGADEVNDIIIDTLTNRRSYTKGQLAFILAPQVDPNANASLIAFKSEARNSVPSFGISTEDLAAKINTSSRVVRQAIEVREFFKTDKTKRTMTDRDAVTEKNVTLEEFFLPRIMLSEDPEAPRSRPYGLGAVIAACTAIQKMAGKDAPHGGGRPESVNRQLSLFENSLGDFTAKFSYWQKWEPETRQAALNTLPPVVEKMPDDLLAEFAKVVKTELKRREK